jgi:hypothetical protein
MPVDRANLFIGTPMYGGVCHGYYTDSLCRLVAHFGQQGLPLSFRFLFNESLITRARNDLVHEFLASSASHLLFIDADIHFDPLDVPRLIALDEPLVCGAYPRRTIDYGRICEGIVAGSSLEELPRWASSMAFVQLPGSPLALGDGLNAKGLKPVAAVGAGFMLIRRDVFETLAPRVPRYRNNSRFEGQESLDFFSLSLDPESNELMGEDYHFCRIWREAGGEVLLAPWVKLRHIGNHVFG